MLIKKPSSHDTIILSLSTYPPRECGIATFTQDLCRAINKRYNPTIKSKVIAINENETSLYNYPGIVQGQIAADHASHYVSLAQEINKLNPIKLVNIQHEFGIFGGNWGDYIIPFLQVIKKPVVTSFHTVLPQPKKNIIDNVKTIAKYSKAIIVMNHRSKVLLENNYSIPKSKIILIPHGIPSTTFDPSDSFKSDFGLKNRLVLTTFGFLSPDKGIQYVIRALPRLIKKHPNLIYLLLGATHPVLRSREGEAYRNSLVREIELLGLKKYVKFYNKYLSYEELVNYLKATDIYISPSLNPNQSVSGTLSYALGCGRPAVSTPSEYAKWVINDKNGILVKFRNPSAISHAISKLAGNEQLLKTMSQAAYASTRHMIWPNVASLYFDVYNRIANFAEKEKKFPDIKLDHLVKLTDKFGLIQHATYDKPNLRFGYSADDNARALIVCGQYYLLEPTQKVEDLIQTYLNFLHFVQRPNGSFANIVSIKKKKDTTFEEDAQGRIIWALGYLTAQDYLPKNILTKAKNLFQKSLVTINALKAPRAIAFAMSGLYFYLKNYPNKKLLIIFKKLADKQIKLYQESAAPQWLWFEDNLTYSNSKLSECLFFAYDITREKKYLKVGQTSLNFLTDITFKKKHYSPIGQNGWYAKGKHRSYYDQQPEDTASMVQSQITAYKTTKKLKHLTNAYQAFTWFLGKNNLQQMVYDEVTGGCHDGVGQYSLNLNEGAESTLSYLLARLEFENSQVRDHLEKI
ncbi:MAG: glycosyl transferase family 1 [Candidatus Doudnabacteria bacterium CG10_big_fil_rev_8_21_14_0_10_41_10]|uniref:Glycosyl transferase family 1 n=1 Tax=Candidatus Doudnabacteria bacterium CG10_big_fil_rev_8_21_14_0_10_41_10 TaxID=1974551 RepID=A0A2H0VEG7_9BACT|nr:MAG: glycosyl transferase family 1 [Candidatus Doudnabacteria bacterium CG10_big_fil_rev_8_21_14_0_10_41_10]